jgi:hypothetical protein
MPAERLAEENARLKRRERLDVAPTDVLGLFVVGRLCRRYGIDVALGPTPGGGVTALVQLPSVYLLQVTGGELAGRGPASPGHGSAAGHGQATFQRPDRTRPGRNGDGGPAAAAAAGAAAAAAAQPEPSRRPLEQPRRQPFEPPFGQPVGTTENGGSGQHGAAKPANSRGLVQRVRGAQLPDTGDRASDSDAPQESPEAARALVEQFEAGALRALQDTPAADRDRLPGPGRDRLAQPERDRLAQPERDRNQLAQPDRDLLSAPDREQLPHADRESLVTPDQERAAGQYQDRFQEPDGAVADERDPAPDQDSHASAVRSFAMEIDRELRRTLESLTAETDPGSSDEPEFRWLDAPQARRARRLRIPGPVEPVNPPPGLTRRVPGAQMPVTGPIPDPERYPQVAFDADAARAAIEDFEAGVARAMQVATEEQQAGAGEYGGRGRTEKGDDA